MVKKELPYCCQIFVCVNDRHGQRKSCADGQSQTIRLQLKKRLEEKGVSKELVRVSQSLCMGLCGEGPNIAIYPQNIWFSGVTENDLDEIVAIVDNILAD